MAKGKPGGFHACPEVQKIIKRLRRENWLIKFRRKHAMVSPPGGTTWVTLPGTPSDPRSLRNTEKYLDRLRQQAAAVKG